jgi:tRNA G18 (ribose-2'-O)-methylase SpoU
MPIVAVAHLPDKSQQNESLGDLVVVLDGVKDHEHLGTVVRTAAVFGAPVQEDLRDGGRYRLAEQATN